MGDLLLAASKGLHGTFSPKATEIYAEDCKSNGASQCYFGNGCRRGYYEFSKF
ncbi:unnamed protein product [Prunus brigantina]